MVDAIVSAGKTDKGSRPDNQDAILLESPFFAVADGAGGHADGAIAAQTAIAALVEFLHTASRPIDVVEAVLAAHWAVQRRAGLATGSDRMATTLTLGAIFSTPEGLLMEIGHVGDSRAYLVSDGRIRQLTRDHTVVADLVDRGQLTPEAAAHHPWRNALTRSIGQLEPLDVDRSRQPLRHGDLVLLVSDGLNKHLTDDEVLQFVLGAATPRDAAEMLVAETNRRGGRDNVSVVCVKVNGDPDATRFDSSTSASGNTATAELLIMPTEEIAAQK